METRTRSSLKQAYTVASDLYAPCNVNALASIVLNEKHAQCSMRATQRTCEMQSICMIRVTGFPISLVYQNMVYLCLSLNGELDIGMVSRLPLLESIGTPMDRGQDVYAHFVVLQQICNINDIF